MALPPLASVDDLEAWTGSAVANEEQAEAVIRAASALVRSTTGRTYVDEDGNLIDDIPDTVGIVVTMVAERVLANPTGLDSATETIAGYSYTSRYTGAGLVLTDTERALLSGTPSSGLSSIRVTAPQPTVTDAWWDDDEEDDEA